MDFREINRILAIALIAALVFGQGLLLTWDGVGGDTGNAGGAHALSHQIPQAPGDVGGHEGGHSHFGGDCSVASCFSFTRTDADGVAASAQVSNHLWWVPIDGVLRAASLERDPPVPRLHS